jgi:zinc D-Ala-D-Ala carboxypeptidase
MLMMRLKLYMSAPTPLTSPTATRSDERLSPHFRLSELTKSDTALRLGIANVPNAEALANLKQTALNILEPIRNHFGIPFAPNSGYRGPALNKAIGGAPSSQHVVGQAVDIEVPSIRNDVLAQWVKDNLDFDQLILEFYTPGIPDSGWVHVSYKGPRSNRKEVLTAVYRNGSTVYQSGLVK